MKNTSFVILGREEWWKNLDDKTKTKLTNQWNKYQKLNEVAKIELNKFWKQARKTNIP